MNNCPPRNVITDKETNYYRHHTAQTLFLGASVMSFNTNMGWGNGSTLTVQLMEDTQPFSCYKPPSVKTKVVGDHLVTDGPGDSATGRPINPFEGFPSYPDNHYHSCVGDSCYIDEELKPYNSKKKPRPKKQIVPGKVSYVYEGSKLVSKYWLMEDPGFFGTGTSMTPQGLYDPNNRYIYNIIGAPVIFKLDNFIFMGIVSSWEKTISANGADAYSVNIDSFDKLLDQSYIIVDKYGGSVFSSHNPQAYSGPKNYTIPQGGIKHEGSIKYGNVHNVFNVYGFLESLDMDGFGGADSNDDGIPATSIIRALQVLTSSIGNPANPAELLDATSKRLFSPFGRLLAKTIMNEGITNKSTGQTTYVRNIVTDNFKFFGVIPPITTNTLGTGSFPRNFFALDLTDIPLPPATFRVSGNNGIISILDFIRQITDDLGRDFFTIGLPTSLSGRSNPIIKIKTINRTIVPPDGQLASVINSLIYNRDLEMTQTNYGKEHNQSSTSRVMYIGGSQQRLLQAKNYRLSYSQTSYIYHPTLRKFVNFKRFNGGSGKGKVRVPLVLSTRNPDLIKNSFFSKIWNTDEIFADIARESSGGPKVTDPYWSDSVAGPGGAGEVIARGNYYDSYLDNRPDSQPAISRYIPLFEDTICPFFGYKLEEQSAVENTTSTNTFRSIRPVWLDSWTGQLVVYFEMNEIPPLSVGSTVSIYNPNIYGQQVNGPAGNGMFRGTPVSQNEQVPEKAPIDITKGTVGKPAPTDTNYVPMFGFTVTETEFRAAAASFDSYLTYCLGKSRSTKPDLFNMLVNAYKVKGIFLDNRNVSGSVGNIGSGMNRQGIRPPDTVGSAGQPSSPKQPTKSKLDMNWDLHLNNEFMKDFRIIHQFVNSIGQKYYGKQYMVRLPYVSAYKDSEYTSMQVPVPGNTQGISVFAGSGKLYYSYELTDSAWEEYGNVIDDCIVIGDSNYYALANENGTIPPLVGYNNSDNIDYTRQIWCVQSYAVKAAALNAQIPTGTTPAARRRRALISNLKGQNDFAANIECGNLEQFYTPILDLSQINDYVEVASYKTVSNPWQHPPLPTAIPRNKKIFRKASVNDIVFLDPSSFAGPRAVISTEQINLSNPSYAYTTDPNLTVISNIALEDTIIYLKLRNGFGGGVPPFSPQEAAYFRYLMSYVSPVIDTNYLVKQGNTSNQSSQLQNIAPKAAHPHFAAVPLKSNQFCYGPWVNYPHFDIKNLFHPSLAGYANNITENMIDNIKIEKNDDFVPWNYGSMTSLDDAVATSILENTDYQSVLEQGSATIKGPPIFEPGGAFGDLLENLPLNTRSHVSKHLVIPTIGSLYAQNNAEYFIESIPVRFASYSVNRPSPFARALSYVKITSIPTVLTYNVMMARDIRYNDFLGPVISNMSMNVDANGINTNYTFRTFSRKNGIWNKENIDRIKKENLNAIQNNKKFRSAENQTVSQIKQQVRSILDNSRDRSGPSSIAAMESKLFGASPTELLIGRSWPKTKTYNFGAFDSVLNSPPDDGGNGAGSAEPAKEGTKLQSQGARANSNSFALSYGQDPGDDSKQHALNIANPVSGLMNAKRYTSNVGMYMADEVGPELIKEYNYKSAMSLDGIFSPVSFYPTPYSSTYSMSSYINTGGVVCPECKGLGYIYETYADPLTMVEQSLQFACPGCSKSVAAPIADEINVYALNPIVVPYGEFKNPNIQNSGNIVDRCRHSIKVVGRGEYPPTAEQSFDISANLEKYVDPNTGDSVNGFAGRGVNADYYEYDIFNATTEQNGSFKFPLNYRFFAFRGPMMMHGWGYDTDGYPVPNAADEPKIVDPQGRPKRFFKKADGTNDLEKDGAFLPTGGLKLGDVIGKGWEKTGGKWQKTKSDYFYLNWAERQDTWPVGPIDIRWDEERKVWAAGGGGGCGSDLLPPYIVASGTDVRVLSDFVSVTKKKCPYQTVYVTLEEDLVTEYGASESYPSRASLDDLQYDQTPLPNNARRVVYVKDRCGYSAPRGAKLLCKYDPEYGFYEPLTKPNYIAFGKISSGNKAILELSYIQGRKRGERVTTMLVTFDNSKLQFNINYKVSTGMFLYENGKWILVSVNSA
jgi:hypothetical protein